MESWLKTHAAMMAPLIACGLRSRATGALSLRDAALAARAIRHAFVLVRRSGSQITPSSMAVLRLVPAVVIAGVLWIAFRFARVRRSLGGGDARGEVVALLDDLIALGPHTDSPLEALRAAVDGPEPLDNAHLASSTGV